MKKDELIAIRAENNTRWDLENEKVLGDFLSEQCFIKKGIDIKSSELYKYWENWTIKNKQWTGSNKEFSRRLLKKGFKIKHSREGSIFLALSIKIMN